MTEWDEWIKTWTFFNWLAIAAFFLAVIGFLNSFLSLRSRYLGWSSIKSRKAFEKRLHNIEVELYMIGKYRKSPTSYYYEVIHLATRPVIGLLFSFAGFLLYEFTYNFFPSPINLLASLFSIMSLFMAWYALRQAEKLDALTGRVRVPIVFAENTFEFLNQASKKGLTSPQGDRIVKTFLSNEMFDEYEQERIRESAIKYGVDKSLKPQ